MDSTTRFWICSRINQKRDTKSGVALLKEMKKRAPLPSALIHDGLPTYDDAFNKELFTLRNPKIQNVRSIGSGYHGLNSKVERLNGTVRDRETVMHGLDKAKPTQDLVNAMHIHYNFIRPHQALKNQTPAEKPGIELGLGNNKVESLMRQAAAKGKVEPYIFELGIRVNKLDIIRKDESIEIKAKGWLNKKDWRDINEILTEHGFSWFSYGKESCWIKKQYV